LRAASADHSAGTPSGIASCGARGKRLGRFRGRAGTAADCAKARGAKSLAAKSRVADLAPVIEDIRTAGANSLRSIAKELNERGISAPRGGVWSAAQVRAAIARIPALRQERVPKARSMALATLRGSHLRCIAAFAAVLHSQRRCLEAANGHTGWSAVIVTVALSLDYRVCATAPCAKIVASPCRRL
jgi:hypothetical protein